MIKCENAGCENEATLQLSKNDIDYGDEGFEQKVCTDCGGDNARFEPIKPVIKCEYSGCDDEATHARKSDAWGYKRHSYAQKVCLAHAEHICDGLFIDDNFEPIKPELPEDTDTFVPIEKWSDDLIGKTVIDARPDQQERLTFVIESQGPLIGDGPTFWTNGNDLVLLRAVALVPEEEDTDIFVPIDTWSDDLIGKTVIDVFERRFTIGGRGPVLKDGEPAVWLKDGRGPVLKDGEPTVWLKDGGVVSLNCVALVPEEEQFKLRTPVLTPRPITDIPSSGVMSPKDSLEVINSANELSRNMGISFSDALAAIRALARQTEPNLAAVMTRLRNSMTGLGIYTTTETTYGCKFKFHDGTVVEIPAPEGDNWESKVIYDEWTPRPLNKEEPVVILLDDDTMPDCPKEITVDFPSFGVGEPSERKIFELTHDSGLCLAHEYAVRVDDEEPVLLELIEYTREIDLTFDLTTDQTSDWHRRDKCISEAGDREATIKSWPGKHPSGVVKYEK
jgi:hypothetical protein